MLIYVVEIKIMSDADGILWGQRELTWTTNVSLHSDLERRFRISELEGKNNVDGDTCGQDVYL